jgi:hypothetical protein
MENEKTQPDYIHPFNDPNRGAIVLVPVQEGIKSFITSTVATFIGGSALYMLGEHLLCKAGLLKNFKTVPLGTAISNQLKDKWMWTVSGVFSLFDGLQSYRDAKAINRQQLDLIRENHELRADLTPANAPPADTSTELAHTQQALANVSHALEVATNHAESLKAPADSHAAKLGLPVESHVEQAVIDKAAAEQATATIH